MRKWVFVSLSWVLVVGSMAVLTAADKESDERWMTGAVVTVDSAAMKLTVKKEVQGSGAEAMEFTVDSNAMVRIHGMRGKLEQLKADDVVSVKYRASEGKLLALEVQHT